MKRIFWFSAGAVSGFGGAVYGYARLRRHAGRPRADEVADRVVRLARGGLGAAREFVDDTREAVREAEEEMRAGERVPARAPEAPGPRRLPRRNGRSRARAGMRGELDKLDGTTE